MLSSYLSIPEISCGARWSQVQFFPAGSNSWCCLSALACARRQVVASSTKPACCQAQVLQQIKKRIRWRIWNFPSSISNQFLSSSNSINRFCLLGLGYFWPYFRNKVSPKQTCLYPFHPWGIISSLAFLSLWSLKCVVLGIICGRYS